MSTRARAVVIGGGIAGLATALRMHRIGWDVLVVERAPGRRSGGYALTVNGVGYDAAERLGLLPELINRHITPDELVYLRPDGSTRFTVPGPTVRALLGRRALSLLRGDIEDTLYQAVRRHVEIRFDTTVLSVTQLGSGVEVVFRDGTVVAADLLIGADGLHSRTRALTFGPEEQFRRDLDHMVGVFMLDRLPDGVADGVTASLTVIGRTLAIISLGDGRAAAFLGYRSADLGTELADGPKVALRRAYRDLDWVAPAVLEALEPAEEVYFDSVSQVVMDRWSSGRTVLLGDAAWCVTLFAGFGASLALAGADLLGTALERHAGDVPAALADWEAQLRPEAERKQRLGRRIKGLYAPPDPFRLWLRDIGLRTAALPPVGRLLTRRLQLEG